MAMGADRPVKFRMRRIPQSGKLTGRWEGAPDAQELNALAFKGMEYQVNR